MLFLATNLCSFFRSFQCSICFQKVENNGYATMLLNHQKRMTSSCRRVSGVSMAYFKVKNKALPRTRRFLHRLFVLTYEPMRLLRPRLMKRFLHNLFSREPAYAGTEQHLKCHCAHSALHIHTRWAACFIEAVPRLRSLACKRPLYFEGLCHVVRCCHVVFVEMFMMATLVAAHNFSEGRGLQAVSSKLISACWSRLKPPSSP